MPLKLVGIVSALVLSISAPAAASVQGWGAATPLGLGADPSVPTSVVPTPLPDAAAATAAAVGGSTTFLLRPDGVLGAGTGFIGDGTDALSAPFTPIPGTAGARAVATGGDATLILRADRTVVGFGYNQNGEAGGTVGENLLTPQPVPGLADVTAVATGLFHSLALKTDGSVWAWGSAAVLGNAAAAAGGDTGTPVQVVLPAGIPATAIAAGGLHGLALLQDGSVWAWGTNDDGQVGDGTTTAVVEPVRVIAPPAGGAPRVTALSGALFSSFALLDNGSFEAWGNNSSGQLGLGNGGQSVSVPIAPLPAVVAARPDRYPPLTRLESVGTTTYAVTAGGGGRVLGWGDSGAKLGFGEAVPTNDYAFPYTGAAGTDGQTATEIPQRVGRLKGVSWLGVGVTGGAEIALGIQTLRPSISDRLPFFSQPVGTVSARHRAVFQSLGDPTTVTAVRIVGRDAGDFELAGAGALSDGPDLPIAIAADGSLSVDVRFFPSTPGERFATLQVEGGGETASIQLSGFGTALPGNTPGAKGDSGTGSAGPAGPAGSAGAAGAPGVAGKDGVVTFTTRKATTTVRRGRTATLSFRIENATAGRLVATTATATLPKALTAKGGRTIAVRALAAGAGRTVSVKVTAGRRAAPGTYTVRLRVPYRARAVTATAKVKVVR